MAGSTSRSNAATSPSSSIRSRRPRAIHELVAAAFAHDPPPRHRLERCPISWHRARPRCFRWPECLRHIVIFGKRHLRHLLRELVTHYNTERFHQALGGQLIRLPATAASNNGSGIGIECRSRLGALLNFYQREAAGSVTASLQTGRDPCGADPDRTVRGRRRLGRQEYRQRPLSHPRCCRRSRQVRSPRSQRQPTRLQCSTASLLLDVAWASSSCVVRLDPKRDSRPRRGQERQRQRA